MSTVYLNGAFKPISEARINVLDRGFIFADSVYEVIPVFNRIALHLDDHLVRLEKSLKATYMQNPHDDGQWYDILTTLINKQSFADQSLYLQVTRGVSARDHRIDLAKSQTVFAMSNPVSDKSSLCRGVKAVFHEDIRWAYCHIKATALLPSILLRHSAYAHDAVEAILIHDGYLTEGAASNVFIVAGDTVITPAKDKKILHGVTRGLIIKLIQDLGMTCKEDNISKDAVLNADEVWLSSSSWELIPVVQINDHQIANGKPGSIWQRLYNAYQTYKKDYCSNDGDL